METRRLEMIVMKLSITRKRFWTDSALALTLSMGTNLASAQFNANTFEYLNQPGLAAINAISAYNQGYTGSGIRVGVLDTGITPEHMEFTNAIVAGYDSVTGKSGTSNFQNFLADYDTHGTHVASIAAGRLDGNTTVPGNMMGVAYQSSLVIGVFNSVNDNQWANSLNYISNQSVKVINNSWGDNSLKGTNPASEAATFIAQNPNTVAALLTALQRGAVIVFANGNDRFDPDKPVPPEQGLNPGAPTTLPTYNSQIASYGAWIAVGATNNAGTAIAYYSDYCGVSKNYCISAPGGELYSDVADKSSGTNGAKADTTNQYVYMQGTSMAAPMVSGAVALVAQKYPWMTNTNLATTILTTGTRATNPDDQWGRGLLDLSKAINGPGLFETNFSANVPTGTSSSFDNNIDYRPGYDGGIIKSGGGTLALTGNNLYTGNTYLNGGTLVASTQSSLGNTTADLLFDGGTLKLGTNFNLTRNLSIGSGGGILDINGYTKTQTFNIYGSGQFGVAGNGIFTLDRVNSQSGGLGIYGTSPNQVTIVKAQQDNYLGAAGSKVRLDGGELTLLNNYVTAVPGTNTFNRPLSIGIYSGTINTGNNVFSYTGGLVEGTVLNNNVGTLYFTGTPFTMGADLKLNAYWDANLTVPVGMALSGWAGVGKGYTLTVNGVYAPGNSPGTAQNYGSMIFKPGSELRIEIDGPGTGNGAGNYDRIVFQDASGTFTAGGTLYPTLRGISGSANNNYSPPLGQGFNIVNAPGGAFGSFSALVQPTDGLLPGTRLDTVYGSTALSLYATPTSYANIAAAGVASNSNRNQTGVILERIRPNAGVLSSNVTTKFLFDSLAPQTSNSLPVALDQLAGVSYAQSIGMNYENTKFLIDENTLAVASQRRGEGGHLINTATSSEEKLGENKEEVWGKAMGRQTTWRGDGTGSTLNDTLGGVIGGIQKHLDPKSLAGVSIAYASGSSSIANSLGSGLQQNLQLMAYGSRTADNGFFVQGSAGGGSGQINASRNVSMMGTNYNALIYTANLAANALAGWGNHAKDAIGYEAGLGVNYMGMHNFGFNDKGSLPAYQLSANATDNYSFTTSIGGSASIPFQAQDIDWRAIAGVSLAHEFGDAVAYLNTTLMGNSLQLQSGSIGRDRLNVGLGITGNVTKQTKVGLNIVNQSAQNWNATAITASARLEF